MRTVSTCSQISFYHEQKDMGGIRIRMGGINYLKAESHMGWERKAGLCELVGKASLWKYARVEP